MNSQPATPQKRTDKAFSLIEVVLALAVAAIGMVAILGLLPQGLQASRDAADNTISATIVHDIFSTIRTMPFTNVTSLSSLGFVVEPGGTPFPNPCNLQIYSLPPAPLGFPPQGDVAYFDQAGFSNNLANAYYKVTLNFQPEIPPGVPNTTPAAVSFITATVVWPALSPVPINTNVFVTKVAQYY
jgi:prepilin-type N-terminal cleavage/methylation domain-containing protein